MSLQAGVVHAVDVLEARKAAIGDGTEMRRLLPLVARTNEEIVTVRNAWAAGAFGEVRGYAGEPLAAPPLPPGGLKPR